MIKSNPFKWRHHQSEIILLCARWYLRYSLSYRNLEEMMNERGLSVDHTTIYRWVQAYGLELEKRCRPHLRPTNDSFRVDETYVKIKGQWYYLYRAVDSTGQTIDFMLTAKRDARAAKRFFRKMLKAPKHQCPRVINVVQSVLLARGARGQTGALEFAAGRRRSVRYRPSRGRAGRGVRAVG